MTSAFIIQGQPQLQPDPNDETVALLRVLIYKIDNTTFGNDVPTAPQWSGPPRAIVQVRAILYASLAASLFSAFLAMLGKQWLNRYASIDIRGSAIDRCQNRQRKLDGIVTWYFDHVMESLPLMMQFALFLLGCALSLYLWGIDTTTALVVLAVSSIGVIFYASIIFVGVVYASCPYQTPGAQILRCVCHGLPIVLSTLRLAFSSIIREVLIGWRDAVELFQYSPSGPTMILQIRTRIFVLPFYLPIRAVVTIARRVRGRFRGARGLVPQIATMDVQCTTCILQTSLDHVTRLLTLKLLATKTTTADLNPALFSACFAVLTNCASIVGGKVVII